MARARQLQDLRADVRKRADIESATSRFPDAELDRYINQGGAELWDILIASRGAAFFRADPAYSFTTAADTTAYALPATFYNLISVRQDSDYAPPLMPFDDIEEAALRSPSVTATYPASYQLRRHPNGDSILELLPKHDASSTIIVEYVPAYTDMSGDTSTFDGISGWEEYLVAFAARCVAVKDDEPTAVRSCEGDMARLKERIQALAPKRDMFRARRVKDVRGPMMARRWGR